MESRPHVRTATLYVALGMGWIWYADEALINWRANPALLMGWGFVLVSGLLIFRIMREDSRRLQFANKALLDSYEQSVRALVGAMDARHRETHDHSQRVARMTIRLARLSGIHAVEELRRIEFGALLHDIGKVRLLDATLLKPGPLNADEIAQIRQHPDFGWEILEKIDFLRPCADIAYCHHENWDGSGYPRALEGDEIPYAARLFSVVDVWDALIHDRVYKHAWSEAEVRTYIAEHAGTQFDPAVVRLFLDHYEEVVVGEGRSISLVESMAVA